MSQGLGLILASVQSGPSRLCLGSWVQAGTPPEFSGRACSGLGLSPGLGFILRCSTAWHQNLVLEQAAESAHGSAAGSANHNPWAKPGLSPFLLNKIVLQHIPAHLLKYCVWNREHMACKPEIFTIWSATLKVCQPLF